MEYTNENIGEQSLEAVVEAAAAIYREHDQKRTLWDVWCHALHHASAVAEEIRKLSADPASSEKLQREIADLALWIFTMLVKLKGPIGIQNENNEQPQDWVVRISVTASELMWNRYPGICPWCYFPAHADGATTIFEPDFWQPCRCDELQVVRTKKNSGKLRARAQLTRKLAQNHVSRRPQSLDRWQEMVRALYRTRLVRLSLTEVALHLLEEMGEVSDGLIRMYTYVESELNHIEEEALARQIRLEDELADVLSWLLGLVERIDEQQNSRSQESPSSALQQSLNERLYLSQILWVKYGSDEKGGFWCRHCKQTHCICPIRLLQDRAQVEGLIKRLEKAPKASAQ